MLQPASPLLSTLLFVQVVPAQGPGQEHEPWQLSVEERLERREAEPPLGDAANPKDGMGRSSNDDQLVTIEGRWQPELMLPWEIFDQLIQRAMASPRDSADIWRLTYRDGLHELMADSPLSFDTPQDFWTILEGLTGDFLQTRQETLRLIDLPGAKGADREAIGSQITALQARQCENRLEALSAARRTFGKVPFDRFLYKHVARHMFVSYPLEEFNPDQLRLIQEGCR